MSKKSNNKGSFELFIGGDLFKVYFKIVDVEDDGNPPPWSDYGVVEKIEAWNYREKWHKPSEKEAKVFQDAYDAYQWGCKSSDLENKMYDTLSGTNAMRVHHPEKADRIRVYYNQMEKGKSDLYIGDTGYIVHFDPKTYKVTKLIVMDNGQRNPTKEESDRFYDALNWWSGDLGNYSIDIDNRIFLKNLVESYITSEEEPKKPVKKSGKKSKK